MVRSAGLLKRSRGGLVGLTATAIASLAWATGLLDRLDGFGLDTHFRLFASVQPDPRICVVAIDDNALAQFGEWTWPRSRCARLIDVLDRLAARAIVMDIAFLEPTRPRPEVPQLTEHYDVDADVPILGEGDAQIIYDDDELARSLAQAGNVYLPITLKLAPPGASYEQAIDAALNHLRLDPAASYEGMLRETQLSRSIFDENLYARLRLAQPLEVQFNLTDEELSERFGAQFVWQHVASAKRLAASRLAHQFVSSHVPPAASSDWSAFFARIMPHAPFDLLSSDRATLLEEYRKAVAWTHVEDRLAQAPARAKTKLSQGFNPELPLDKFAAAAKGFGFVAYQPRPTDVVVRSLAPVVLVEDRVLAQLGIAVAAQELGLNLGDLRIERNRIIIPGPNGELVVPVDRDGAMLINWTRPSADHHAHPQFAAIPAGRALQIDSNEQDIFENERRRGLLLAELVRIRHADTPSEYARFVELTRQWATLRQALPSPLTMDANVEPGSTGEDGGHLQQLREVQRQLAVFEKEAIDWLTYRHRILSQSEPRTSQQQDDRDLTQQLYDKFIHDSALVQLDRFNEELAAKTRSIAAELAPSIKGRLCFVGHTATGMPDLVPTPVAPGMPGVYVHAQVANTMLCGQFARAAPTWANLLLIVFVGALTTLFANARTAVFAALGASAIALTALAAGALLFLSWTLYFASLPGVVAVVLAWGSVTAYRQLTEERTRRKMQRVLAQYTSQAVAARLAENLDTPDLRPTLSHVTCFMSDLRGFTRLSEQLGPDRTRSFLNPYLHCVSTALVSHGAMVNKFLGDGIFAFFNAPILPCSNHEQSACNSALDAMQALARLQQSDGWPDLPEPLLMRIGLASGEGFVGDYGSDAKLDYTCIGDTANLCERLEKANKAFGTRILVDDATRRAAGDAFAFRCLGRVRLPGKESVVTVHELLDWSRFAEQPLLEYARQFEQAVRAYQNGELGLCEKALAACRTLRSGDEAIRVYQQALARLRSSTAPAASGDGTIELADL